MRYSKDRLKNKTGNILSRKYRLRRPSDFKKVYQSKQWGASEHYTFNVLANTLNNEDCSRLGVTVSKKVAKQAVVRNRIKRQIKEFYRCHSEALQSSDLVITAKPSCARVTDIDRLQSLEQLWIKVIKWQRWYLANNATQS